MKNKAITRGHAKFFPPSGSDRWLECTKSVKLIAELPPGDDSNEPADRGTAAHELLDKCLQTTTSPASYIGKKVGVGLKHGPFIVDKYMADAVEYATDYVSHVCSGSDVMTFFEADLDIPVTGENGHVDISLVKGSHLYVIDYKNGVKTVEVKNNSQVMLYALGVLEYLAKHHPKVKITKITLVIIQPNDNNRVGPIREHTITMADIKAFEKTVAKAVKAVKEDKGKFVAGAHCKWCPLAGRCPEVAKQALKTARQEFAEHLDATPLTNDELGKVFALIPFVSDWVTSIQAEVAKTLAKGETIPGVKLVEGSRQRYWSDEAETIATLRSLCLRVDDYAPRKLGGIGAIEKLLDPMIRAETMKELTSLSNPKIHAVPETDSRPSIGTDANVDFSQFLTNQGELE